MIRGPAATAPPSGGVVVWKSLATLAIVSLLLQACGGEPRRLAACDDPTTPIAVVQGAGFLSPLLGQRLSVEGVLTQPLRGPDRSGGFLQAMTPHDDDPNTSEALFVSGAGVSELPAGSRLRVTGTVRELGDEGRSLTALEAEAVQRCGQGELPAVTPLELPADAGLRESLEAMRVRLDEVTVVDQHRLQQGSILVAQGGRLWQPTEVAEPGAAAQLQDLKNRRRELELTFSGPESALLFQGLRNGDRLMGLDGVLDQGWSYRLRQRGPFQRQALNLRSPAPDRDRGLRLATFNLLNYFNGDGQGGAFPTGRGADSPEELERQRRKLVAAMQGLDAELFALSELENDGFGPSSAIAELTGALAGATGRDYRFVRLPDSDRIGGDEITVGLIYDGAVLETEGPARSTAERPFEDKNRQPLAQTFRRIGSPLRFTAVAVHLKSKGCGDATGSDAAQGDGQGCWNERRLAATRFLPRWIGRFADPEASVILGDFNAQSLEDPIRALLEAGYRQALPIDDGPHYSYVFRGRAGTLDHALLGPELASRLIRAGVWHINADEPRALDYNLEGERDGLYQPDAYRSSDHDPLYLDLTLEPSP